MTGIPQSTDLLVSITFRNDPTEYAHTHIVVVEEREGKFTADKAVCDKELPDTMKGDLDQFAMFINTRLVDCTACVNVLQEWRHW